MARETEVKYEAVAAACVQLLQLGESVSFLKVYQLIGNKGGQAVVSEMIRRWRQETAATLTAQREGPLKSDALVAASDKLLASLWQMALGEAEVAYQQKIGELAMKESEWQMQLDLAAERLLEQEKMQLKLEGELKEARAIQEVQVATIAEKTLQLAELQSTLAAREEQISALREDQARTIATLESERARHDERIIDLEKQHEVAVGVERDRHAAAIREINDNVDKDRRHFLTQVDALNQAAHTKSLAVESLKAELLSKIENAKAEANSQRINAGNARDLASKYQGQVELLQGELAEAKKLINKIHKRVPGFSS